MIVGSFAVPSTPSSASTPQAMAAPPFGIYTPLVTYFSADETLDLTTTAQHALRMAEGGVAGLVLQGSNGEAPHLLHDERQTLVRSIRKTLDDNGHERIKLIVGCGASSVFESCIYINEAQHSGADYALILPPSYWTTAMSPAVVEKFFSDVRPLTTPRAQQDLYLLFPDCSRVAHSDPHLQLPRRDWRYRYLFRLDQKSGGQAPWEGRRCKTDLRQLGKAAALGLSCPDRPFCGLCWQI